MLSFGDSSGDSPGECGVLEWSGDRMSEESRRRRTIVEKFRYLWARYGTPRNVKAFYVMLTLVALVVAGGAPGSGSGNPSGG